MEQKTVFPFGDKTYQVAELKATGPKTGGRFEAIVSVFGNVDSVFDRMVKGAFERTLKAPPEGRGFPAIVWSHLWGIVPIGAPQKAEEVTDVDTPKGKVDGLFIDGELLVQEHQTASEVYAAMRQKGGDGLPPLREFSFGYRVRESATVTEPQEGSDDPIEIREIKDVDLFEVGPTLVGANDQTALLGVKAQLEKGLMTSDLFEELKSWLEERMKFYAGEREREADDPDVGTSVKSEDVSRVLASFPADRVVRPVS